MAFITVLACSVGLDLVMAELAPSKSEARRLVKQGGVRIDGETIRDEQQVVDLNKERTINAGKLKFVQVKAKQ